MAACLLRGGRCTPDIAGLRQGEDTEIVSALCRHDAGDGADVIGAGVAAWQEPAHESQHGNGEARDLCTARAVGFWHDTSIACVQWRLLVLLDLGANLCRQSLADEAHCRMAACVGSCCGTSCCHCRAVCFLWDGRCAGELLR